MEQVHQDDVETANPTARTVLREEIARFFDHEVALARSWSLTHQGLSQKRARELVNTPVYDKILTNHLAPYLTDQGAAISWMTDRLSGKKAYSNCWSMPVQP